MAKTREQLKDEKARALLAGGLVREVADTVYEVQGGSGVYEVTTHESGRIAGCTCPAGSTWMKRQLRQSGKHVCYHTRAVAMLRKGM